MNLPDLIEEFIEHLEVESGRSRRTAENYRHYLDKFYDLTADLVSDEYRPDEITTEVLRKFRLRLNREKSPDGSGLKTLTQSYYLIALRGFLKYLAKRGIKSLDPTLVELPHAVKKQVTFLHFDEVEDLLNAIPDNTESGLRDRAIVELLFSGGLRVSELVNLNRGDINLERREFMVRGKGSKDRPIFISVAAADRVREYLSVRHDDLPALFLNNSKNLNAVDTTGNYRRLTARSIQRIIDKYSRLAGITKHVTPHTLRHSFATDLLMNGADIRSVQALLGHADISTTQIYTHVTDPHLKEVHEKYQSEA